MSDDIRIYGGQGHSQPEGDPHQRRAEALRRFKRGHSAGDLVEGIFLRLEPGAPGTAWVSLEGTALLAALPQDLAALATRIAAGQGAGATPTGVGEADFPIRSGELCFFMLEATEPDPVLRMLGAAQGSSRPAAAAAAEARWQSLLRLPLTQLAARYTQKRSALEGLARQKLWTPNDLQIPFPKALPPALSDFSAAAFAHELEEDDTSPQARYTAWIKGDEASQLFADLEPYRAALVQNLSPYGLLGFFFVPWLCPAARTLEIAFMRQRTHEAAAPDRAAAMQGVTYQLQGLLEKDGAQERLELAGILSGAARLRQPDADEPDLLRQILALKPEGLHPGFSRKA